MKLEEFLISWLRERRLGKTSGKLVSAFYYFSRSANEEPRKEAKEVKYSGEWWLEAGVIPSSPFGLCPSNVSTLHKPRGEEKVVFLVLFLVLSFNFITDFRGRGGDEMV